LNGSPTQEKFSGKIHQEPCIRLNSNARGMLNLVYWVESFFGLNRKWKNCKSQTNTLQEIYSRNIPKYLFPIVATILVILHSTIALSLVATTFAAMRFSQNTGSSGIITITSYPTTPSPSPTTLPNIPDKDLYSDNSCTQTRSGSFLIVLYQKITFGI
jgi:hypothetical protein